MPAPRLPEFQERPQLPTITAPSGLPFLGSAPSSEKGPGGLGSDQE